MSELKRLVIKVGTQVLTTEDGKLDLNLLRGLANQISVAIQKYDCQIVLVSSGAISCGREHMINLGKSVSEDQAAAAVGQILLMQEYGQFFRTNGFQVGQLLLTRDAIEDDYRAGLAKSTIQHLLQHAIIPIINENDSVSIDEIKFGDNDQLSSLVANLIDADLLILLTDIDGVYDANPKTNLNAKRLESISNIHSFDIEAIVQDVHSGRSKGGMQSKLSSARFAASCGIDVVIANGKQPSVICDILAGKSIGTRIYSFNQKE